MKLKRLFAVILLSDTVEDLEIIKQDLANEISCCWQTFEIKDVIEFTLQIGQPEEDKA